jgi:4-hydroxybenzoate polyprenyltransferase
MIFGLFTELAILDWDLELLSSSWLRIIAALGISISSLPYVWMINDYYDAPFDQVDEDKRNRNYFCSSLIMEKPTLAKLMLITPVVISFAFTLFLGIESMIILVLILLSGHFYSAPPLRLKERFFLDLLSHGLYASSLFFVLGGLVFTPLSRLFQQPLFLIFFSLSFIDGVWLQYNAQLLDYKIDQEGSQNTTSILLGKRNSLFLLQFILSGMLLSLIVYLLFNQSLNNIIPREFTLVLILFTCLGILLYLRKCNQLKEDFNEVRKFSAWLRRKFVYPFGVLGVLLINFPLL